MAKNIYFLFWMFYHWNNLLAQRVMNTYMWTLLPVDQNKLFNNGINTLTDQFDEIVNAENFVMCKFTTSWKGFRIKR